MSPGSASGSRARNASRASEQRRPPPRRSRDADTGVDQTRDSPANRGISSENLSTTGDRSSKYGGCQRLTDEVWRVGNGICSGIAGELAEEFLEGSAD